MGKTARIFTYQNMPIVKPVNVKNSKNGTGSRWVGEGLAGSK